MKKLSREIWIVAAKRTPFGALSGGLKDVSAIDLAVHAGKAAIAQSGAQPKDFDHVILGNVQQTSADAIYGARHVGLKAGLPIETPALTVNRLCGSGFQAVVNAAEQILLGEARCVLAGGSENMSQAPHVLWGLRDGAKFGKPPKLVDSLWEALTDSYCQTPMAVTAENLAEKYGITREMADAFALRSQKNWAAAQESGAFSDEISPMEIAQGRKTLTVDRDEHARPQTTLETLAKLPTVFKKDGVVTAGNASGICDGAAMLVVADAEWAKAQGLKPLAKLVQWGVAGVEPSLMGIGPAPAIRSALDRAGDRHRRRRLVRRQRGVRAAVLGCTEGSRPARREGQRERRRHRSRSPARSVRRPHHRELDLHLEEARQAARGRFGLYRRRPGHRGGSRVGVTFRPRRDPSVGHGAAHARTGEERTERQEQQSRAGVVGKVGTKRVEARADHGTEHPSQTVGRVAESRCRALLVLADREGRGGSHARQREALSDPLNRQCCGEGDEPVGEDQPDEAAQRNGDSGAQQHVRRPLEASDQEALHEDRDDAIEDQRETHRASRLVFGQVQPVLKVERHGLFHGDARQADHQPQREHRPHPHDERRRMFFVGCSDVFDRFGELDPHEDRVEQREPRRKVDRCQEAQRRQRRANCRADHHTQAECGSDQRHARGSIRPIGGVRDVGLRRRQGRRRKDAARDSRREQESEGRPAIEDSLLAQLSDDREGQERQREADDSDQQHRLAPDALAAPTPERAHHELHERVARRQQPNLDLGEAEPAPERCQDRKQHRQAEDAVEQRDEQQPAGRHVDTLLEVLGSARDMLVRSE